MADEAQQSEIERLRAEVESHRQRELSDLRSALAAAREELRQAKVEASHFRGEAERNATTGRMIASEAERQIADLRTQLQAKHNVLTR